jgi:DNA end-binding protein Ku
MSRAMWSGSISFGLVSIPVRLHPAVRDRGLRFHQVDAKDRSRIRQRLVNETTGREVPRDEIVKCFEVAKDECIILDPKEIAAAVPEASRIIEIKTFVELSGIDPVYFDRPYYLAPDSRAGKAYGLLVRAMEQTGKAGIARFVMRGTEYLAAIRPKGGVLCLETMHFADEIVEPPAVEESGAHAKATPQELKAAEQLIEALSTEFNPEQYPAEHRQRLLRLIEAKAEGGGAPVAKPRSPEADQPPRVLKLVDALKASLEEAGKRERAAKRRKRA